jgi:alpha-glucosidase
MDFLSAVPTVWDETRVLEAKIGDYLVMARKHGDDWYLGGLTDWSPRIFDLKTDFLEPGKNWIADIWQDGVNADRQASDYKKLRIEIKAGDNLTINLGPGGGLAIRFTPAR